MAKKDNLTFEAAVARLDEIVKLLERGNTSLDDSLKLYEEGVGLVRFCNGELENAERRIKMLVTDDNGELTTVDFSEDGN